jgi:hypothetical protein
MDSSRRAPSKLSLAGAKQYEKYQQRRREEAISKQGLARQKKLEELRTLAVDDKVGSPTSEATADTHVILPCRSLHPPMSLCPSFTTGAIACSLACHTS